MRRQQPKDRLHGAARGQRPVPGPV
jgi:hypothetical protein